MIGSIIDGIGKSVTGITASIVALRKMKKGDQAERDRMAVESTLGAQKQLVAEFTRADRNWYDTLISAINRVPRPAMVFLTVAYFVYSFYSPQEFAVINEGLATVPDQMWYVLLTIISFYFGSRHLEKRLISTAKQNFAKTAKEVTSRLPTQSNSYGVQGATDASRSEKKIEDDFDAEGNGLSDKSRGVRNKLYQKLQKNMWK